MMNKDNGYWGWVAVMAALIMVAIFLTGMGVGASFQRSKSCAAQCPKSEATLWDSEHQRCRCLKENKDLEP